MTGSRPDSSRSNASTSTVPDSPEPGGLMTGPHTRHLPRRRRQVLRVVRAVAIADEACRVVTRNIEPGTTRARSRALVCQRSGSGDLEREGWASRLPKTAAEGMAALSGSVVGGSNAVGR